MRQTSPAGIYGLYVVLGITLTLFTFACSVRDTEEGVVLLPNVGSEFALVGIAPAGMPVESRFFARINLENSNSYTPPVLTANNVDMVVGGLSNADLPQGLTVESLSLVAPGTDSSRPLLSLRNPYILAAPSPADQLTHFVSVEDTSIPTVEAIARQERLNRLLSGTFIQPPCVGSASNFEVTAPQTPAQSFSAVRVSSQGVIQLGLVSSGTAAIAIYDVDQSEPRLYALPVVDVLLDTGRIEVAAIGPNNPEGVPNHILIHKQEALLAQSFFLRWDTTLKAFVDNTPPSTRQISGLRKSLPSDPSLICIYGAIANDNVGWCRTQTSTSWSSPIPLPTEEEVTEWWVQPNGPDIIVDRIGRIYVFEQEEWLLFSEATINIGCSRNCAVFDVIKASRDGLSITVSGSRAQLQNLLLDPEPRIQSDIPFSEQLFRDERPNGEQPIRILSVTQSQNRFWWIGTARGTLFRADPQFTGVERVCLPSTANHQDITAIGADDNGRLILGLSSGLVILGQWRTS